MNRRKPSTKTWPAHEGKAAGNSGIPSSDAAGNSGIPSSDLLQVSYLNQY